MLVDELGIDPSPALQGLERAILRPAPSLDRAPEAAAAPAAARAASFTSTAPGAELARLASELDVDLVLAEAPVALLAKGAPDEQLAGLLADAPCALALLVSREAMPERPVLVPFGGAEHDWAGGERGGR